MSALYGSGVREVVREDLGIRFCFVCRCRRGFALVVFTPVDPQSYREPFAQVACANGHIDGDLGFGRTRDSG